MVRFIAVYFCLVITAVQAGQGVVVPPAETLYFPISNSIPFSTTNSTRLELRLHAWTQPQDLANVISLPGIQLRLAGSNYGCTLIVTDWLDTFAPGAGNGLCLNFPGRNDVIIRVQRDTAAGTLSGQVWNANGIGTMLSLTLPFTAAGAQQLPAQAAIGDATTNCVLDYVRWFSSVVPPGTSPFAVSAGDLADFEFEGLLTDSSPQNVTVSASAPPAFAPSPVYSPVASQGLQRVLHAGVPEALDGSLSAALNGSLPLTYQWAQISGPTQLQWSSTTGVAPTVTGMIFGSYQVQLTVTDSSGQTGSNTLKYGAVFTNSSEVVIPSQSFVTPVLGPLLRLGASPWPYFDTSNQQMADFFGGLQTTDYMDVWNVAQAGTVSVINGSTAVTGTGTTFLSTFCGGGNNGNNATLIVSYPVPGNPGQWGRAPNNVVACQSDTSLTLSAPYSVSPSAASLMFASMDNNAVGTWIGGSSNANYYDNVMAFYSLYYRSGIDDYLNYARTLADRWYTMPWFDQGRASLTPSTTLFPRLQSITGLVLRALDGHPDYWPGIEQYLVYDYSFASSPAVANLALGDIREQGYATAFLALAALYDPTPANQAMYQSEVNSVISNVWAPSVQPGGNWMNITDGYATWNGTGGTVSVRNGSNIVNGVNTTWQQNWFTGNSFWTADQNGVTNGDAVAYTATVIAPNQLSLNMPYQGPDADGRGWEANSLVGVGTQPFMLGVVGNAFRYAYFATKDARLPGYLNGIENWFASQGFRPDARGLWYGRVFPNCEPISVTNTACNGGNAAQSRFLSGEIVGAVSGAYLSTGNAAQAAFGDNIFGAMFGGPFGGPDSDSIYVTDVSAGGWAMQTKYAKDFGFFFGFGGGPSWPAARLGTAALPPGVSCSFSLLQTTAASPNTGGAGAINVKASDPSCSWTAVSTTPMVAITAGAAGSGTGVASYLVSPNPGSGNQTEIIVVADQTFTITQAGVGCNDSISPSSAAFTSIGGAGTINITATDSGCSWTAATNASWATLTGALAGNGSGPVTYAVAANPGSSTRTGTITAAGQVFSISQTGTSCSFTLGQTVSYIGSGGGIGTVSVAASAGTCGWTAVSNASYIKITAGSSGTGNGTVSFSVSANPASTSRTGTLLVAGITLSVIQSPGGGIDGDIGSPQLAGSASANSGVYVVSGAGTAIWGTSDQFNYNHWQATGNGTITARLTSLTNTNVNAKAGVMVRQSLMSNSPNAYAVATPTILGNQSRLTAGGASVFSGSAPVTFPIWLRVSLANGVLTSYSSPDGKAWKTLGAPQSIAMTSPFFGLAVTSQNPGALNTATFDNVTITQP